MIHKVDIDFILRRCKALLKKLVDRKEDADLLGNEKHLLKKTCTVDLSEGINYICLWRKVLVMYHLLSRTHGLNTTSGMEMYSLFQFILRAYKRFVKKDMQALK